MGRRGVRHPPFTHGFIDRHGKARWYFRRAGFSRVPLPGLPWSPEFMAAHEAAMQGQAQRVEIGVGRTKPGTVNAAVIGYFSSSAFQSLAPETRRSRRNILERFAAENGDKRIALLQRGHIDRMVAAKASTPAAARNFLKTLHALIQHCIAEGLRTDDPTQGVKSAKIRTDGSVRGQRKISRHLRQLIRSAHALGSHSRCCFTPRNGALISCG